MVTIEQLKAGLDAIRGELPKSTTVYYLDFAPTEENFAASLLEESIYYRKRQILKAQQLIRQHGKYYA